MRNIINWIWITLLVSVILALILVLINVIKNNGNFNFMDDTNIIEDNIKKKETINGGNVRNLNIDVVNAKLNLYYSDDSDFKIIQYANNELKNNYIYQAKLNNNTLSIKEDHNFIKIFNFFFMNNNSVINVYIPKDLKLDIEIDSISKDVNINEDLNLTDLDITTVSGNVNMKDITSQEVYVKTVSGNISGLKLTGENEIKSTSGDIKINEIIGETTVKTVSGVISIEQLTKSINAKTTSGDININSFLLNNDSKISSVSGKIDLTLRTESNVKIKTNTVSGKEVLPNKNENIGNPPFKDLEVTTTSGNIYIAIK